MFPVFLKTSLVFRLLLFSSITKHCSLKKGFLSLLAILWNSTFNRMYLYFSSLLFTSLHSSAICKTSSDSHFTFLLFFFLAFLLLFFLEMVLFTTFVRTILWMSVHSSEGTLSSKSSPLTLSVTSIGNSYRILFKSFLSVLVFFPIFFCLSLNFAMRSWWTEPQSAPGLVFVDYI